ncbi:cytochrome d ubiquinol oxidase subunit II [Flavobacteriaceae bacterium]|nr:cytochrome d ubiquinol oxidase subunit II [Flavobacteriaceae bacterium]
MIDITVICALLIVLGIILYVILDGFDLGVGIIFPFAPDEASKNKMMSSIAPVWDGNETWLIYGGGILFAAFPIAYSILLPALYIPLMLLIFALMFRGVAFEFRMKAKESRWIWDYSFTFGSTLAAFSQGLILGSLIEGFEVKNMQFAGGSFNWLTSFSITTGFGVVFGYALLGASWAILKTDNPTKEWAKNIAKPLNFILGLFVLMVSLKTPIQYPEIADKWFSFPNFFILLPIPLIAIFCWLKIFDSLSKDKDNQPFIFTVAIFILSFVGLGYSLWPYIIVNNLTIWDLAAPAKSLQLVFITLMISFPIVLGYTLFVYKLFKGKVLEKDSYY